MKYVLIFPFYLALIACGNGGVVETTPTEEKVLADGLKIFVTAEAYNGNFLDDSRPEFGEISAVEKADLLCNSDRNKPDERNYKALFVDGIDRDAVSLTNWVLKSNSTYYLPYKEKVFDNTGEADDFIYVDVEIATTNSLAIFPFELATLNNRISEKRPLSGRPLRSENFVYTGVSDESNFAADGLHNCENWSTDEPELFTYSGTIYSTNSDAIKSSLLLSCDFKASLYCVEQE